MDEKVKTILERSDLAVRTQERYADSLRVLLRKSELLEIIKYPDLLARELKKRNSTLTIQQIITTLKVLLKHATEEELNVLGIEGREREYILEKYSHVVSDCGFENEPRKNASMRWKDLYEKFRTKSRQRSSEYAICAASILHSPSIMWLSLQDEKNERTNYVDGQKINWNVITNEKGYTAFEEEIGEELADILKNVESEEGFLFGVIRKRDGSKIPKTAKFIKESMKKVVGVDAGIQELTRMYKEYIQEMYKDELIVEMPKDEYGL